MLAAILTQMQSKKLNSEVITFHLAPTMCLAFYYGIGLQQSIPSTSSKSEEDANISELISDVNHKTQA